MQQRCVESVFFDSKLKTVLNYVQAEKISPGKKSLCISRLPWITSTAATIAMFILLPAFLSFFLSLTHRTPAVLFSLVASALVAAAAAVLVKSH